MSNTEHKHHKHHHSNHSNKREKFSLFFNKYGKWGILIIFAIVILSAIFLDRKNDTQYVEQVDETAEQQSSNYDGIITIIDGEGEETFTETWGELISEGYPICSDIVVDNVGKNGYMNWETIKALNDVGVEFLFHSSNHVSYADKSIDEIEKDIQHGIDEMENHGLNHDYIVWLSSTQKEKK